MTQKILSLNPSRWWFCNDVTDINTIYHSTIITGNTPLCGQKFEPTEDISMHVVP